MCKYLIFQNCREILRKSGNFLKLGNEKARRNVNLSETLEGIWNNSMKIITES